MKMTIQTLTPLWTGGVDQTCDRLHETGLLGSLRWWYEALARGLGGYACDPTEDKSKCKEYDPKLGTKSVCAACYLFGTTGWARLFRLQVVEENIRQEPLHFFTTLEANQRWLGNIFRVNQATVPFGKFRLDFVGRGQDEEYTFAQLAWALEFATKYGGLGAKLQHGFGQIALASPMPVTANAEQDLKNRFSTFKSGENNPAYPSRQRFFSHLRKVPASDPLLRAILQAQRVGSASSNAPYISCAIDLRYKGGVVTGKQPGFRQWLVNSGWKKDEIRALMGETKAQRDDQRSASRIYFSMPWKNHEGGYTLRVFGFLPPTLEVDKVNAEVKAYLDYLFGSQGG
jgi:CRISPR-associated protein Cmr1